MTPLTLKIVWHSCTEYVPLLKPLKRGEVIKTKEWWPEERRRVEYSVECLEWSPKDPILKVALRYSSARNESLAGSGAQWGRSDIEVNFTTGAVTAQWTDTEYCGSARRCELLEKADASYFADMKYETLLRLARPDDAKVRDDLLRIYGACAITGVDTPEVLDLAHIIEARDGGRASLTNCMLLRTDLHRLFDSCQLGFDMDDGKVKLEKTASEHYQRELRDRHLDGNVFRRVKEALALRARSAS